MNAWKLTDEERKEAEQLHRQLIRLSGEEQAPVRLSLTPVDAHSEAQRVAEVFIEQFGGQAEMLFAGAFFGAQADHMQRMSLQPGATRQMNGKTYTLNENHRWTRQQGGQQPQAGRQMPAEAGPRRPSAPASAKLQPQNQPRLAPSTQPKLSPGAKSPQPSQPKEPEFYHVDVEADSNKDGVTDAARVGVPAFSVPPPPARIPRLSGLEGKAKQAEESFASAYERNPEGVTTKAIELFKQNGKVPTFETDLAKRLSSFWNSDELASNLEERSKNRATLNNALHQTANAITKRAFVQHLDTLPKGSEIMVTVGGCGAGKGYALGSVPEAQVYRDRAAVVWDSAGDQNATENPWILQEATKRGLTVSFVFVHADPYEQWSNPERGVVKRAQNPNDGRMVDAKVFADSYAIGAKNHHAFWTANQNNKNANFVFLKNGNPPSSLPQVPLDALQIDRKHLAEFAQEIVKSDESIPAHVREGALQGSKIWKD